MSALACGQAFDDARKLINGLAAQLQGKKRGRDPVHRNSYDENDPRAQPWEHNRFATSAERIATIETLVETAEQTVAIHFKQFPRTEVCAMKAQRLALIQERAELEGMSPADRPVGRLATIRQELDKTEAWLEQARLRLREGDIRILEKMLSFLCATTGQIIPSGQKIADRVSCSVKTIWRAQERLIHHGFIDCVLRSRKKPDSDGQFGPQREQISKAYFLNHRRKMSNRIYQRFLQLRARRHKRLMKGAPRTMNGAVAPPQGSQDALGFQTSLGEVLRSFGASLANANPT